MAGTPDGLAKSWAGLLPFLRKFGFTFDIRETAKLNFEGVSCFIRFCDHFSWVNIGWRVVGLIDRAMQLIDKTPFM